MTAEKVKAASTFAASGLMTAVGAVCGAITTPEHLAAAVGFAVAGGATSLFVNLFTASHAALKSAAQAERNHLLRRGMAEALRVSLEARRKAPDLPPLPADPYDDLFKSWVSLLADAAKDDGMLDGLFPIDLVDKHWQTLMRYEGGLSVPSDGNPAYEPDNEAIALKDLLRDYLTHDQKRQGFLSVFRRDLTRRWNEAEALEFSKSVVPLYRRAFEADFTRGGPLSEAFELRALREQRDLLSQLVLKIDSLLEPGLPLTTIHQLRALEPVSYTEILRFLEARHRTVQFVGRHDELANLWAWLTERAPVSIRLLAGRGGLGKTRLGIRLLELLEEHFQLGWHAGFLDSERCESALNRFPDVRRRRPTLIIIDDASRWAEIIASFVVPAIRNPSKNAPPLRLLLIDRGAQPDFRWYRKLVDAGEPAGKYIFAPIMELRELPNLSTCDDRIKFLDAALYALHSLNGQPKLALDESARKRLANNEMGDPLVLCMAALLAHERRDLSPLEYRRLSLARALAGREEHRIAQLAQPEFLPLHMAAYITLTGGLSEEDLHAACGEEKQAVEPDSAWGLVPLNTLLREKLLPSRTSELAAAPILPDIVGEVFVESMLYSSDHDAIGTIYRAFLRRPDAVTSSLMKLAWDLGSETIDNDLINAHVVARRDRLFSTLDVLLAKLVDNIEKQGGDDPSANMLIVNKVMELASQSTRLNPPWFCHQFAVTCWRLGKLLSRRTDSLDTVQAVLDISFKGLLQIKALAICRPEDNWDLAVALADNYIAACLRRPSYVVPAFTHSLTYSRTDADRANLDPAFTLSAPFQIIIRHNSDNHTLDVVPIREVIKQAPIWEPERTERLLANIEGLHAVKNHLPTDLIGEVRQRLREYKEQRPTAVKRETVARLMQQVHLWNDADHPIEAKECLEECWPDLEMLVAEDRHFLPTQAAALALAADLHNKLFDREQTITFLNTAVALYRELAQHDPRYAYLLSLVLVKLALINYTDNKPQALALIEEASPWCVEAAKREPLYVWFWGSLQHIQGTLQFEMGNHEQAFQMDLRSELRDTILPFAFEKACAARCTADSEGRVTVHTYQPPSLRSYYVLEFERRDPFGRKWREALEQRRRAEWMLLGLGDHEQTPHIELALQLARELTESDRPRFLPFLIDWLNWYQQLMIYGGKLDEALRAIDEAFNRWPESDSTSMLDPQLLRQQLLLSRDIIEVDKRRTPPLGSKVMEIAERCSRLVTEGRSQFLPLFAQVKELEARILVETKCLDAAVSVQCDAARAWEEFCRNRPSHVARLADCLFELAKLQAANAKPMDAMTSISTTVRYYLDAPRVKYHYPHVLATLADALQRQFLFCCEGSSIAPNTLAVVNQQVQQLRKLVATQPTEFSELLLWAQMSQMMCLSADGHDDRVLADIGEVAIRGEELVVKKPELSGLLGWLYFAWGEELGQFESVAKFTQATQHYAKMLRLLARQLVAAAPSAPTEQATQIREAYIEACKRASIKPDPEVIRPFGER